MACRENPHEPARNSIDLEKLAKLDQMFNKVMARVPKPGEKPKPTAPTEGELISLNLGGSEMLQRLVEMLEKEERK